MADKLELSLDPRLEIANRPIRVQTPIGSG
jgi:hypothetical protein